MKTVLVSLLLILSFAATAQKKGKKPKAEKPTLEMDSVSGKYVFRRVVAFDSTLDVGTMFDRVLQWVPRAYRDANTVIQYQDRTLGKIIVKGYVRDLADNYWHTVIIECRPGRMRYTFTDFTYLDTTWFGPLRPVEVPAESKGMLQKMRRATYAEDSQNFGKELEASVQSIGVHDADKW
jgi:hypothetical protein